MAASIASCKVVWIRKMLAILFDLQMGPTMIHNDNQSCIKLFENHVFRDWSKYIEIIYHFIKDIVQRGVVRLQYISIEDQVTDVPTKPLVKEMFMKYRDKLGVVENPFLARRDC